MNGTPSSGDDVALFIDWENFKISLASGHRTPNVSALKEEVGNHGRVVVAKAYADWVSRAPELRGASQFTNDPPALYAAGIEPVYVPTRLPPVGAADSYRTARIKNSVDVKMTADCIECAHSYSNIGTYVLVSGDSDFIHVINTLRAMGKKVIIIGVSWSTSRRLADQVDGLILYDMDVDPATPPEAAPAAVGERGNGRTTSTGRQPLSDAIGIIEDIVRVERQAGRMPLLTSLKQRVTRQIPGFDEKKLGYSGFKKLMQRVAQEGNIKLVTVGLVDWVLMADEPDPQEQGVETTAATTAGGEAAGGEVAGGEVAGGEVAGGEVAGGEVAGGEVAGGEVAGGEVAGGEVAGGEVAGGEVAGGEVAGGEVAGGEVAGGEVAGMVTNGAGLELAESPQTAGPQAPPRRGRKGQPESLAKPAVQPSTRSDQPGLAPLLAEELSDIQLPEGPGDGLDGRRVADLIVMADNLEHREGISHVAFNFLVGEVCLALGEGLKAENEEITQRWAPMHSRIYVTRLIRSLSDAGVFQRGWHTGQDEDTGRSRRRRTFNLDRNHPLVVKVMQISSEYPELESVPGPEPSAQAAVGEANPLTLPPMESTEGKFPSPQELEEADPSTGLGKVLRFFSRS